MNSHSPVVSPVRRPRPAGNLSTGLLKLIALLFMFIDHSGKVLFNNMYEMRVLGRIAFPIYVWCMIVGFSRTRSVPRYLLRILVTGLVSQPLYLLALDYQGHVSVLLRSTFEPLSAGFSFPALGAVLRTFFEKPNVFLSLFLGLAALWGVREKKAWSHLWAPAAALVLASVLGADYGWKGILFFLLMYAVQGSRPGIAAVMVAYFLFWGSSYQVTSSLFGVPLKLESLPAWLNSPLKAFMRLEGYGLLALPLLLIRFPRDLRLPRWLSYMLYPGHLVLLIVLKVIVFGW